MRTKTKLTAKEPATVQPTTKDPRDEVLTLADETIRCLHRQAQETQSALVSAYWIKRNALRGAS